MRTQCLLVMPPSINSFLDGSIGSAMDDPWFSIFKIEPKRAFNCQSQRAEDDLNQS